METKIIKRNGGIEPFNKAKIYDAVYKALAHTGENIEGAVKAVNNTVERVLTENEIPTVYSVEKIVFEELVKEGLVQTAKTYESYRAVQEFKRTVNTTDDSILRLNLFEYSKL